MKPYPQPYTDTFIIQVVYTILLLAQLAGAVKYTDCISAERWDFLNKCPVFDTKQSDGKAPVMCINKWLMFTWIVSDT